MEHLRESRITASGVRACGLAVSLVAIALAATALLQNVVSTAGFIFFYVAVLVSAWFGGKWAGLIAVILSAACVLYFFTPPVLSFAMSRNSAPLFIEFAASAAIVGWFSSWRRMAETELKYARDGLQLRVDERTAELRHSNEQLMAEIAERRRAEQALYEARTELARVNRISALGTLAASISHEVNQPLAAVVANADACSIWLSSNPPNLEEARAAIESVAREGTRASDVVRRIRGMFTKAAPESSAVRVNDLIREVRTLLEAEISRYRITVETELADGLPAIAADRVQMQQVLVNLMTNGMEAMSTIGDRPRILHIRSATNGGQEVMVSVSDSGPGIAPADQRRIFDAFFTTKSEGMGIGLAISQSIIEAHGGRLWASSNEGPGATFAFTLPVAHD